MDIITLALARKYTNSVALNGVPVQHPRINPVSRTWEIFNPTANTFVDTGIVAEGVAPEIINGTWWIRGVDTNISAEGISSISPDTDVINIDNGMIFGVANGKVVGLDRHKTHIHSQGTPSAAWHIQHNFNESHRAITMFVVNDDGEQILGQVDVGLSTNNLLIYRFGEPLSGRAYLKF